MARSKEWVTATLKDDDSFSSQGDDETISQSTIAEEALANISENSSNGGNSSTESSSESEKAGQIRPTQQELADDTKRLEREAEELKIK